MGLENHGALSGARTNRIGILCDRHEQASVREFFELFKTPWEFCTAGRSYEVVLSTRHETAAIDARVFVVYGSERGPLDDVEGITVGPRSSNISLDYNSSEVPIYGNILTFAEEGRPLVRTTCNRVAGLVIDGARGKLVRVGYDLFQEAAFLLSAGQPMKNAHIPTLELHIAMLRGWILDAGIPVVEVPPVPIGYECIACLTHDVDFVKISDHKFDHTAWGFLYRAVVGSLGDVVKQRISWDRFRQNWKAALSLPGVYLGLCHDFWLQDFDRYRAVEQDLKSTFFLIPFKNRVGDKVPGQHPERRATRYDVTDVQELAKELMRQGCEVGVHGIDAWHSPEQGRHERQRVTEVIGRSAAGVRMHWLCFDERSPQVLEEAGFLYDSTFGYNDTVGYRGGTTQVFRPLGARNLLELPLHIQDTALFSPRRSCLTEAQAWRLCEALLNNVSPYGGVLTLLWHTRSLAPERLWGDFYVRLLKELRVHRAWFATASQVVDWFRSRRAVRFHDACVAGNALRLRVQYEGRDCEPHLMLRVHIPRADGAVSSRHTHNHIDVPWTGAGEVELSL